MRDSEEVVIIGAGPVGLVLAMLLARRGQRVVLYEGRQDPRLTPPPSGRSINFTLAERGWRALRTVDAEEEARKVAIALTGRAIHGEDGVTRYHPYGQNGEALYAASRTTLHRTLIDLAEKVPGISLRFNHRCRRVDLERRTVWFDSFDRSRPQEIKPAVLIGADGAHSTVRRALFSAPGFQFEQRLSPYHYKEIELPADPSGDWPLRNGCTHVWPRGEGMLVAFPNVNHTMTASLFLPVQGPRSFAAVGTPAEVEALFDWIAPDIRPRIPNLIHDFFSGVSNPLLTIRCSPWSHGGWLTLIGDAAHAIVPFLGQGLNAGLEDAQVLAEMFDAAEGRWEVALAAFDRARVPESNALCDLAEGHFEELAVRAREPAFVMQKKLEQRLHQLAPERFAAPYNMISFDATSFVAAQRELQRQEAFLSELLTRPEIQRVIDSPALDGQLWRALAEYERGPAAKVG